MELSTWTPWFVQKIPLCGRSGAAFGFQAVESFGHPRFNPRGRVFVHRAGAGDLIQFFGQQFIFSLCLFQIPVVNGRQKMLGIGL
jgi:hypothetical protein